MENVTKFFGKLSAITETTVTVTLESGADVTEATKTESYTVKSEQTDVAVTAVTYNATTKKATLTVDLNNKEGKLTVNGTEGSFDFKAPTVSTVK